MKREKNWKHPASSRKQIGEGKGEKGGWINLKSVWRGKRSRNSLAEASFCNPASDSKIKDRAAEWDKEENRI